MTSGEDIKAPRVFLSYASEDVNWVIEFKRFLVGPLGNVVIDDFKNGGNLQFGKLGPWLDQKVSEASVMIAFVSSTYAQKDWTKDEWQLGLTKRQRGQLIFVPVMMDADAKTWWNVLRKNGELALLPADFQYVDFTHEGRRATIEGSRVQQISDLAATIRLLLASPEVVQNALAKDGASAVNNHEEIVLLGHPSGRFDVGLEAEVAAAEQHLRGQSLPCRKWDDGWRKPAFRPVLPSTSDFTPLFVHPIAPGETDDPFDYAEKAEQRLKSMGVKSLRLALWLPSGQGDDTFETAAKSRHSADFPALRVDTPEELALWLGGLVRPITPDALVIQIEAMGYPNDAVPDPTTTQLAEDLEQRFCGIVNREIVPNPGLWKFWGEEFNEQLRMLPGNRAIIAVHDLDIKPSADIQTVRNSLETKLKAAQEAIEQANREDAQGRKVDPFFTALLVRHAKALPFATYPSNGRFKDWRLLRFEATGVRPVPASLAVFRGQLTKWNASRRSIGVATC
jgi:hypothetical protein